MSKIYKSKWGEYFDLSHILLISQIYRGDFGDQTKFHVEFILRDKPIIFDFCSELGPTVIDYHKELVDAWIKYKENE